MLRPRERVCAPVVVAAAVDFGDVELHEEAVVRLRVRWRPDAELPPGGPAGGSPPGDEGQPLLLLGGSSDNAQFYSVYSGKMAREGFPGGENLDVGWQRRSLWPGGEEEVLLAFAPRVKGEYQATFVVQTSLGSVMVLVEGRGVAYQSVISPALVGYRAIPAGDVYDTVGVVRLRNPSNTTPLVIKWAVLAGIGTAGTKHVLRHCRVSETWQEEDVPESVGDGMDDLLQDEDTAFYAPYVAPGQERDVMEVYAYGLEHGERLRGHLRVNLEIDDRERVFMLPIDLVFEKQAGGATVSPVFLGDVCGSCGATTGGHGLLGRAPLVIGNAPGWDSAFQGYRPALRVERIIALPPQGLGPASSAVVSLHEVGGGMQGGGRGQAGGSYEILAPGQEASRWELSIGCTDPGTPKCRELLKAAGDGVLSGRRGKEFYGELKVLFSEVDVDERFVSPSGESNPPGSAWISAKYSGKLLPPGTCVCPPELAPGRAHAPRLHSPFTKDACLLSDTLHEGVAAHLDLGMSFPGGSPSRSVINVIANGDVYRPGGPLPGVFSVDPRFIPVVQKAFVEGGVPHLEVSVTLDPARGLLSEKFVAPHAQTPMASLMRAEWGGGELESALRESCEIFTSQSAMMRRLDNEGHMELASPIILQTEPALRLEAHARMAWPVLYENREIGRSPSETMSVDFGFVEVGNQKEPLSRGSSGPAGEQWVRVVNPLADRPVSVRLLGAWERSDALMVLEEHGCNVFSSLPTPPRMHEENGIFHIGPWDATMRRNASEPLRKGAAVHAAELAPGETINLGPIYFKPPAVGGYSGIAAIANDLTGIETVPLSGAGGTSRLRLLNDGRSLRILEKDLQDVEKALKWGQEAEDVEEVIVIKSLVLGNPSNAPIRFSGVGFGNPGQCKVRGYEIEQCHRKYVLEPGQRVDIRVKMKYLCDNFDTELKLYLTEKGQKPMKFVIQVHPHARCAPRAEGMFSEMASFLRRTVYTKPNELLGVLLLLSITIVSLLALSSQPQLAAVLTEVLRGGGQNRGESPASRAIRLLRPASGKNLPHRGTIPQKKRTPPAKKVPLRPRGEQAEEPERGTHTQSLGPSLAGASSSLRLILDRAEVPHSDKDVEVLEDVDVPEKSSNHSCDSYKRADSPNSPLALKEVEEMADEEKVDEELADENMADVIGRRLESRESSPGGTLKEGSRGPRKLVAPQPPLPHKPQERQKQKQAAKPAAAAEVARKAGTDKSPKASQPPAKPIEGGARRGGKVSPKGKKAPGAHKTVVVHPSSFQHRGSVKATVRRTTRPPVPPHAGASHDRQDTSTSRRAPSQGRPGLAPHQPPPPLRTTTRRHQQQNLQALLPQQRAPNAEGQEPRAPLPVEMGGRPRIPREAPAPRPRRHSDGFAEPQARPAVQGIASETFGADGMGTGTVSVLESLDILGTPDVGAQLTQQQQPSRVPASLYSIWQDDSGVSTGLGTVAAGLSRVADPQPLQQPLPPPPRQFRQAELTPASGLGLVQEAMVRHLEGESAMHSEPRPWDMATGASSSGFPSTDPSYVLPDVFNPADAETFGTRAENWQAGYDASDYGYTYE